VLVLGFVTVTVAVAAVEAVGPPTLVVVAAALEVDEDEGDEGRADSAVGREWSGALESWF
jgi:hypothetical protein